MGRKARSYNYSYWIRVIFPYFKSQQNALIKLQQNRSQTQFLSGANSYIFRQQGAIFREFISKKSSLVQQLFQALFPHISKKKNKSLQMLKFKLRIHVVATPIPHKKPLCLLGCGYKHPKRHTNQKDLVRLKHVVCTVSGYVEYTKWNSLKQ